MAGQNHFIRVNEKTAKQGGPDAGAAKEILQEVADRGKKTAPQARAALKRIKEGER